MKVETIKTIHMNTITSVANSLSEIFDQEHTTVIKSTPDELISAKINVVGTVTSEQLKALLEMGGTSIKRSGAGLSINLIIRN